MSSITLSDTRTGRPGDAPPKLVAASRHRHCSPDPRCEISRRGPVRSQGPAKVTNDKARPPKAKPCDRCVWTQWRGVPVSPRDGLVSRAAIAVGLIIIRGSLLVGDLLTVKATD
jgi:hypothetical protein